MKCPFMKNSSMVPRECTRECALYYQEYNRDGNKVINMHGCSFRMIAQYLDEIRYCLQTDLEEMTDDGDQ